MDLINSSFRFWSLTKEINRSKVFVTSPCKSPPTPAVSRWFMQSLPLLPGKLTSSPRTPIPLGYCSGLTLTWLCSMQYLIQGIHVISLRSLLRPSAIFLPLPSTLFQLRSLDSVMDFVTSSQKGLSVSGSDKGTNLFTHQIGTAAKSTGLGQRSKHSGSFKSILFYLNQ